MGYSARYHAASLAAVFIALGVGILIGAGLGSNVLNDTEEGLRKSLESDLDEARAEGDDLRTDLANQGEFARRAYPALVGDRLARRQVGVVAFGDLPGALSDDIEEALDPTGAELAQIAVVRTPPDVAGLAEELKGTGAGRIAKEPERLRQLGRRFGEQLARGGGGGLVERAGDVLLSRSSGEGGPLDHVIVARTVNADVGEGEQAFLDAIETGITEGLRRSRVRAVAVERTDAEESSVPFFSERDLPTVDNIESVPGQVSMVFALLGANGDFGTKESADRLLPELLAPSRGG